MFPSREEVGEEGDLTQAGTSLVEFHLEELQSEIQHLGETRCLEATPVRYDAAKTHQVRDCPWPAQQGLSRPPTRQPNFKVVLFPENDQLQQPQQATVSMGQLGIADQYYDQYYDQYHYSDQYYQPQEEYATASISEDL